MKIIWSPLAIDRAAEIAQYIFSDNPTAAQNWIGTVFAEVELLKSSPKIGRIVPEITQEDFREIILGNYRIIYRIEKKSISILTIRHGKQILPVEELSPSDKLH
ncbi:type II toxin-antitoxin system RelE/ParE family toxin [Candidatus Electrothrix sp.]|uniref:type II toxin-antitoxin system RelE/ParE family toxin n=1 Tax=Candidatus Electrothrix sp. TaxID=2170559 RepID=UPI0040578F45